MVAVCTDTVDKNRDMVEKLGLDFPVLSDPDLVAVDAYDLRHVGGNPMEGKDISRPGIFIIDGDGIVRWSYLTDNWRVRARPEMIVQQLTGML